VTAPEAGPTDVGRWDRARRDYEALRSAVVDGGGSRELGLALLMRDGMPAWIRAWSTCTGLPSSAHAAASRDGVVLPDGVRGEITRLLVTMALDATREEVHA
jgi:hypothetical protein